jgi:hypothetical protein
MHGALSTLVWVIVIIILLILAFALLGRVA